MESNYANVTEIDRFCMVCKEQQETSQNDNRVQAFLRYVDDIVNSVRGEPGVVQEAVNKLHPNLQFALEELDCNGSLTYWI